MKTRALLLTVVLLPVLLGLGRADSQWVLEQSTLTYHISHPLHDADGISHSARGKGICQAGQCNFLVAVLVNSFNSGNSNRDLHMLQVTRGAQFPLVTVRFQLPEAALGSASIRANLRIQFAGQAAKYNQVLFHQGKKGKMIQVSGTIPLKLSDFKISRPELLAMPISNDVPVKVDTTWEPGS
ncbi:MAG TPA: YceI family protein [Terriglobia bacterium]|nr:YceI family protein [Terriglobia bacterium]